MGGRRIYHAAGKVLGGSSSINGMIFQRGNPLDYERWAADPGMDTWDHAHCLPYFRRMESCLAAEPADEYRGHSGPLVLERGPAKSPLFGAFFEAVQQAGYPLTDDVNGYRQEGFAPFDRNVHRGRRLSAARAYLHPVSSRPNLDIRTRAFVNQDPVRRDASGRGRVHAWEGPDADGSGRRGDPLWRRHQHAADPAALRGRKRGGAPRAGRRRGAGRPRGRRASPGSPRGLRAAFLHATGVGRPGPEAVAEAVHRGPVAVLPFGPRGHEPFRGGRLRPEQRRGRLSEPDVPLPARRRSLRRVGSGRGPRLPGAHRTDVLGCAGVGEDREHRPPDAPGPPVQLPVDRPGSAGMGGSDPGRADDPLAAGVRPLRRR